jgi:hypothetical protein
MKWEVLASLTMNADGRWPHLSYLTNEIAIVHTQGDDGWLGATFLLSFKLAI